jgi:hypothetical protein
MNRRDFDIDHIDPCWEEGRDYQLVCGFERSARNLREEDPSVNTSKSNRFLPWRWSRDEIGVVPEEPGDLAYFLVGAYIENDVPGEWVLMEFLSEEWFKASWETCSLYVNGQTSLLKWQKENPEAHKESSRKGGIATGASNYVHLEDYYQENPEKRREHSLLGAAKIKELCKEDPDYGRRRALKGEDKRREWREENPELVKLTASLGGSASGRRKYKCKITGKVSTLRGLMLYQRNRNIDPTPENRIRIQ